jgi:hypothetical protein
MWQAAGLKFEFNKLFLKGGFSFWVQIGIPNPEGIKHEFQVEQQIFTTPKALKVSMLYIIVHPIPKGLNLNNKSNDWS